VIRSFANPATEDIFNGVNPAVARRACPQVLWAAATRKLDLLDSAEQLADLRIPPGNRREALRKDRSGQDSLRVNERYRICFRWSDEGPESVEIVDYHSG
jgi:proteic killer suppression protein